MPAPLFALVDCNNFFVSCERIFRPELEDKPVIVLSSNDGCAVARSNEAKALGIPMGAPVFKYRQLLKEQKVVQFSANFELYGDISQRIVSVLSSVTPQVEVYSVDESFLDLSELVIPDLRQWGEALRRYIARTIGVPVSIGIAPSKTLAKLAADRAKKDLELAGVCDLSATSPRERDAHLAATPLRDIWGVGWRLTPRLRAEGLHTALDLSRMRPALAGQLMGVHGRHLVAELQGQCCIPLETRSKPQQSIMRGRTFGEDTNKFYVLEAALASLTARGAACLRREGSVAGRAAIMLDTNKHKPGFRRYFRSVRFATPTADTGRICEALLSVLADMYNPRASYHRANVFLLDLVRADAVQGNLLDEVDPAQEIKAAQRMRILDSINRRYGSKHLYYAAEDLSRSWQPKHNLRSPRYTSSWDELPTATVQM